MGGLLTLAAPEQAERETPEPEAAALALEAQPLLGLVPLEARLEQTLASAHSARCPGVGSLLLVIVCPNQLLDLFQLGVKTHEDPHDCRQVGRDLFQISRPKEHRELLPRDASSRKVASRGGPPSATRLASASCGKRCSKP